jgi:hypothetical protein
MLMSNYDNFVYNMTTSKTWQRAMTTMNIRNMWQAMT